jgi:putative ATPase
MSEQRHSRTARSPSPDLFEAGRQADLEQNQPLAARLRPENLEEFVGQDHILGPGRLLRRAIQADQLSSLIFYGPPGTGKTTLAHVIANTTRSHFITINAVLAGVAAIREAIEDAQERRDLHRQRTILFVDEVHRFNKAQQDALLPWVENGTVILVGATTENPYFSVNRPLVSRSRLFQLKPLDPEALRTVALHALDHPRGYGKWNVVVEKDALDHLVNVANGDARSLLNALELAVETTPAAAGGGPIRIDLAVAEESIQKRAVLYDKEGDYHFDTISAFIKSLRGSDPDAAMYWLARMVYAGEDPSFIFRRMLIFASEDVGAADPQSLQLVAAAAEAFDRVGLPEGRFHLAQAALQLATAPKSNSVLAFFDALAAVENETDGEVPNHLKDASRDSEGFGHGANYLYPHAYRDHWVAQQYLPSGLQGRVFYQPSGEGRERAIQEDVRRRRELQLAAMVEEEAGGGEVLAVSPEDRLKDQWLRRAAGEFSGHLGSIRERIFGALSLERHHRVLDLNAGTGLLSWEAARRVPAGGVWSVCGDMTMAVGLRETAAQLDELDRPTVLECGLDDLEETLRKQDDPGLRFDAVIGRNALGPLAGKADAVRLIAGLMAPEGRISLVENIQRQAQRLSALVPLDDLEGDLGERVLAAEEGIYEDSTNPRVSWDADDLAALFEASDLAKVNCATEIYTCSRRIAVQQLGHWFNPGGEQHHTFAHHLRRHMDDQELHQVHKLFEQKLTDKHVQWTTTYLHLTATAP